MSKAAGFPLECKWESMSCQDKRKVLHQLGSITWQLSTLRFGQIGSLVENDGGLQPKTCLCRGLVTYDRHELEDIDRGPYNTAQAYFNALVSAFSGHARFLPTTPHCLFAPVPLLSEFSKFSKYRAACDRWNDFVILGDKVDSSQNRLDYVIAGDLLSDMLAEWLKSISASPSGQFPLRHPDLSVNNIFIDDEYNITCLIDWGFASTVPLSVLLTAPGLPQSRDKLNESLVSAFEEGFKTAIFGALQDQDAHVHQDVQEYRALCQILQCSRPMWLVCRFLDFDSLEDFSLFRELWNLIGPKHEFFDAFRAKQSMPYYRRLYEEMKREDEPAEQISRFEQQYFKIRSELDITISKKLALVSDWHPRYDMPRAQIRRSGDVFVADRRLWHWIDAWLEDHHRYTE